MERKDAHTVIDVVENTATGRMLPSVSFSRISNVMTGIPRSTGDKPTQAPLPPEVNTQYDWAIWGTYDDIPTIIRQKINQVPIAGRTIYDLVRMSLGNGLAYYRNSDREQGNVIKRHYSPTIEKFLQRNRIVDKFLIPQLYDYRYGVNAFSEMVFNKFYDQVTGIFHKSAEFCRLTKKDKQKHYETDLLYSPYFGTITRPKDDDIRAIKLYHYFLPEEEVLRSIQGTYKLAWHTCLETPGRVYYATPPWIGLFRENGWIDASKAVPEVVNAMMKNQVRLKYQILIPESYFTIRYRDSWSTMGDEKRSELIDDLVNEIDTMLSGPNNSYMSLTTIFNYDNITKTELGKVQIVAIDDKVKNDEWVPSSEKSDAQIVQSLGGHPSHVGLAPESGKMGSGSGSDKREMYNIEISSNTMDQSIILQPLNWLAQFNAKKNPDWDVTFFIDHTHHTTTNNQEDGMQRDTNKNLIIE